MLSLQTQIYIRPSCLKNNARSICFVHFQIKKSHNHFHSTVIKLPLIPEHSSLRLRSAWQVI